MKISKLFCYCFVPLLKVVMVLLFFKRETKTDEHILHLSSSNSTDTDIGDL